METIRNSYTHIHPHPRLVVLVGENVVWILFVGALSLLRFIGDNIFFGSINIMWLYYYVFRYVLFYLQVVIRWELLSIILFVSVIHVNHLELKMKWFEKKFNKFLK